MSKAKGETQRRELGRISVLERRMRQLIKVPIKKPGQIAEISAIEWAIPILEQHLLDKYGDEMPQRVKWHKHEKRGIVAALWARDGNTCYLCTKPLYYSAATIDHVMPLAKGGKDDMSNYRLVHPLCNIQKGNMTLEQFNKSKEMAGVK